MGVSRFSETKPDETGLSQKVSAVLSDSLFFDFGDAVASDGAFATPSLTTAAVDFNNLEAEIADNLGGTIVSSGGLYGNCDGNAAASPTGTGSTIALSEQSKVT